MKPLNRKELFKKTRCCLEGQIMFLICFFICVATIIFFYITKDIAVYLSIVTTLFLFIMLIVNNNIQYFLDLIFLEYKITDIVIENRGNGPIQKSRFNYIGGYHKIICIDGKKLTLVDYHKINVPIPDYKSDDQYKLIYLKYSKIIIDSIIIHPEPLKNGKKYKKRR